MKTGRRGCIVFIGDDHFEVPGFSVTATDTTGAGRGLFCRRFPFIAASRAGL